MSATKLDFRLKLLAGNNVVLVEANGFETELFMPQVSHGRIRLQNIIPNRRCCYLANLSSTNKVGQNSKARPVSISASPPSIIESKKPLHSANAKQFRIPAGQDLHAPRLPPLAYSTPKQPLSTGYGKENRFERRSTDPHSSKSSVTLTSPGVARYSTLRTPEPGRCTVLPTPFEVVKDAFPHIPSGIRVIRLYRNDGTCTQKNMRRIEQNNCPSVAPTVTPDTSGFRLPATPEFSEPNPRHHDDPMERSKKQACDLEFSPKWRKCITPARTYARRNTVHIQRLSSGSSIKKTHRHVSSTQGYKGSHIIDIRKRKLIMDPKTTIPQRTNKMQSKNELKKSPGNSQLPRTKKQYQRSKSSAFELLTNSNRERAMSSKLKQQFRKGCTNKTCSTCPKYKLLCTMPSLEPSEKVRERRQAEKEMKQTASAEAHEKRRKLMAMVEQGASNKPATTASKKPT